MNINRLRIGDLLLENGYLTQDQLQTALARQARTGQKLGSVLTSAGVISETELMEFLSHQLQIPIVDLNRHDILAAKPVRLPAEFSRRHRVVVIEEQPTHFLLGMVDPTSMEAIEEATGILGKSVQVALVREAELLSMIELLDAHFRDVEFLEEDEDSLPE